MTGSPSEQPGKTLEEQMNRLPPEERSLFLAHLERKFRAMGDLEVLREIKAYKALASSTTLSRTSTKEPPAG